MPSTWYGAAMNCLVARATSGTARARCEPSVLARGLSGRGNEPRGETMSSNDPIEPQLAAIPDRASVGLTRDDTHEPDTKIPPSRPSRSAASAPNVLVVLVEDVGFGPSSAFGGPCETPIAERLAERGLRYRRFHTTGLCATTRAALLGAESRRMEPR